MTTQYDGSTFTAIVADLRDALTCAVRLTMVSQCPKRAEWWVDYHGCDESVMCTEHLNGWRRRWPREVECTWCAKTFPSIDAACRVVAL